MKLWSHQQRAVEFCRPLAGAGLFLEMGVGKTLCALTLLRDWEVKHPLIVCPKAVRSVWAREIEKHGFDWQPLVLTGPTTERAAQLHYAFRRPQPSALIVNYESIWREPLMAQIQANLGNIGAIVADESHRVKAPGGVVSRALARIGPKVRRRLCLTGTPLPHSPLDAYGQYRFLAPGIFGFSFVRFRARYAVMGGFQQKQVVNFRDLDDLHRRMYSVAYRVTAAEVLDLPEYLDEVVEVELSPGTMRIYKELEKDFCAWVDEQVGEINAAHALTKLLRLQQLTGGWVYPEEGPPKAVDTGKGDALHDLMEGMGTEPVVVFARFLADLDQVQKAAAALGMASSRLDGRTNELESWLAGETQVLACQIRTGGLGIDLTRARYCVYYSHGLSLGDYEQSRARVHRPGQTRPVTYYHLIVPGTVDQKIYFALEKRADLIRLVVDEMRRCL